MRGFLKALLWIVGVAFALTMLARYTMLRWWRVPSNDPVLQASIAPSLAGGDLVLLWRGTKPKFGDLVLCPEPGVPNRLVVGRIVGQAGDRVKLKDGSIWVNDEVAQTETACAEGTFEVNDPYSGNVVEQSCWMEALGGESYKRGNTIGDRPNTIASERTVQEGKAFLLSDNRQYPYDSRDFGTVDVETCTESVFFRLVGKKGFFDVERRFTFVH